MERGIFNKATYLQNAYCAKNNVRPMDLLDSLVTVLSHYLGSGSTYFE